MILVNNLQESDRQLLDKIKLAVNRVLESGWYILGPEVKAFEAEFAAYCGAAYCSGVANGTDALELALRALGVCSGDIVATVANAGMYSTTAIQAIHAQPLFVEIDPISMTMDPVSLKRTLSPQVKAIIVTHLYGQMANMPELIQVAQEAGIPLIEDCAQAHGAISHGKKAGSWGALGCFSFYPTKNLGALGDGGAVITSDPELAARINKLRQYGWEGKYKTTLVGGCNSRLDELQAAILRVKLPYLDGWNQRRKKIASLYNEGLKEFDVFTPSNHDDSYVAHLYVLRTSQRNELRTLLQEKSIGTEIHYPIPDYLQPIISNHCNVHLPVTEKCCAEILTLPCYPQMTSNEVDLVITKTLESLQSLAKVQSSA